MREPKSKSVVHLIGVSHGSPASANLVESYMLKDIKPDAVVVELCEDRFLAISLDSKVIPRQNAKMIKFYNDRIKKLKERELKQKNSPEMFWTNLWLNFKFIKSQGLISGIFVSLGLVVSGLQRLQIKLKDSNSTDSVDLVRDDEFVTAMKAAEQLNIPVKLGDADQNVTLSNISSVISKETFQITDIVEGWKDLLFSAFGCLSNNNLTKYIDSQLSPTLLKDSQWINIPVAYAEDYNMIKSLTPILTVALMATLFSIVTNFDESMNGNTILEISRNSGSNILSYIVDLITNIDGQSGGLISNSVIGLIDFIDNSDIIVDIFSVLLLIRLAKIIGTDRDRIIASKIQQACEEFPNSQIVVVIGMLHCNGVAKWLLSGLNPLDSKDV